MWKKRSRTYEDYENDLMIRLGYRPPENVRTGYESYLVGGYFITFAICTFAVAYFFGAYVILMAIPALILSPFMARFTDMD